MSLFQVQEWWSVGSDLKEEYSFDALAVGNVDNDPSCQGSLHGTLRMYLPAQKEYRIEHLLLETNLKSPILQVTIGYFSPHRRVLSLAVLHPRRLSVYLVEAVGGFGMTASYVQLSLEYEHALGVEGKHFTAYNMIHGEFTTDSSSSQGGRNHLCVQSMEGRLQFFEQDRFSFLHVGQDNFLPRALCFVSRIRAIVASTLDYFVECYRYQVLASTSLRESRQKDGIADTNPHHKPIITHADWRINVGESVLEIRTGNCFPDALSASSDIVVLGEFTLFCIKPKGLLYFQKRMDFAPATMCLYPRNPQDTPSKAPQVLCEENYILASHSKLWMIFKGSKMVWSACAFSIPMALSVASFGGINGMIVCLDAEGKLSVNYLGTEPPSTAVASAEHSTRELNYDEMEEEHRRLLSVIRRTQIEKKSEPKDRILLRVQVPSTLDSLRHPENDFNPIHSEFSATQPNTQTSVQLTVRILLTFTGVTSISQVQISVSPPANVVASETIITIASIPAKSSTPLILPVVLSPHPTEIPSSSTLLVTAVYTLSSGQPRVSNCEVELPLCLLCHLIPPVTASTFKFTLETNQAPCDLSQLFQDICTQPLLHREWTLPITNAKKSVLSFQCFNGFQTTILVSKNAGRYRIQSDHLEALWIPAKFLVTRLQALPSMEIVYREPLPLADFFRVVESHLLLRNEKSELAAMINDRAQQFRVIQKRLLIRYKDKSPSDLHSLDVLLYGTYQELNGLSVKMEAIQGELLRAASQLGCCVSLMLMLLQLQHHIEEEAMKRIRSCMTPFIQEELALEGSGAQGWEERMIAGLKEMLQKETFKDSTYTELSIPTDIRLLRKQITVICGGPPSK
uniref:Uncharacterized protein AlNc14C212G8932 n=1 Tax=Albugo laibachii Nc14 TaxID=890382 RepID=F0WRC7_9STRA|nr:conserved hypothetical protein [Albugo laibachii Nc14]|eukprot:CCA23890.1 conserved hypothetical protein [Albugo laibachii Nc14]